MPKTSRSKRAITKRNNPLENPSISLASPAIWAWLNSGDPTAAGELINEITALQAITVYACVRVIAESVASLPLKLYTRSKGGRLEAVDSQLYYLLTVAPNPEMTAFTFFETLTGCLSLTGNCYAQIVRDQRGRPVELYPLHPLKTEPFRKDDNSLAYRTSDGEKLGKSREIPSADVLHVPLFCFDGLKGFSPVHLARQGIGLSRAAEKFGARFFGNGSRPGGILSSKTPNLDEVQMAQVRDSWASSQGGANQGKTAVLPGEWTYTQIGLSPEDSQFLATRKFQREDIAGMWRVPPHMVGDTSRLSNANHEQESLQFVTDTMRPYLCRFEQEIARKMLPTTGRNAGKQFVEFDVRERLRGDFKSAMTGYALGRQWGFFTANVVLEDMGMNPVGPEGDVLLYPTNMANAKDLLNPASERDPLGGEQNGRALLQRFALAYIKLFRDAVGRISARNKRDLDAVSAAFRCIYESISEQITVTARQRFDLADDWKPQMDRFLRDSLSSVTKRAASWTPRSADEAAGVEMQKAVRSLSYHIFREAGSSQVPPLLTADGDDEQETQCQ